MFDPATIAIMLGSSGAVLAIARGISQWMSSQKGAKITVRRPDGNIIVQNLSSKDISKILELLTQDLEKKDKAAKQGAPDADQSSITRDVTGG